jgi:outer membrane protein OmpA-like peptidoglycan-associated protein/tetratricopeptide (TPR) repeat protein
MVLYQHINSLNLDRNFKCLRMRTAGIIVLLLIASVAPAQTQMDAYEAEELFSRKHYSAVWKYYYERLKADSLNPDLNYKMGVCYMHSRSQKDKAIACFNRILKANNETVLPNEIYRSLGDAFYSASDFDRALVNYGKYQKALLSQKESNKAELDEISRKMELCTLSKELKELKELTCTLMKHKCNAKGNNYRSLLNKEVSSYAIALNKPLDFEKKFLDDDFYETGNTFAVSTSTVTHKPDTNNQMMESTVATSIDGQIILIYRNENGVANLYVSRLNKNEWMLPEKLNKSINDNGWETDEVISADGNAMYFSSIREGGFGGKDIYRSVRMPNGDWGKAINLGPAINTPFDEEAPFIHPDGTLFFSSNRYKTKGGYNNYKSAWCDSCGGWSEVQDVSYPLYKHNRNLSKGQVVDDLDNYRVNLMGLRKKPLTMIKGKITDSDNKNLKYAEITVTDNESGQVMGTYYPDREGKYIFVLPAGKNLSITYQSDGYLFHSENMQTTDTASFYRTHTTVALEPLKEDAKVVLNNVFFEDGKAEISPTSMAELNRVHSVLMQNPKLGAEFCLHPDKEKVNAQLAEERMQSVINYLSGRGIAKERMTAKVSRKKVKEKKRRRRVADSISGNGSDRMVLRIVNF